MRQFLLLLSLLIFVGCQTAQNPTSELATQDTETQTVIEQTEPMTTEEVAQSETSEVPVEQKTYDHSKIAVPSLDDAWNKIDAEHILSSEAMYVPGWQLPEQTALAELIVKGTITDIGESFYVDSKWHFPLTPATFVVDDVLFGLDVEKEIKVYFLGGVVSVESYLEQDGNSDLPSSKNPYVDYTNEQKKTERIAIYRDDTIPPEVGQELVLFLEESPDFPDGYRPLYASRSIYFVDEMTQGIANLDLYEMARNIPESNNPPISRLYFEELEWFINHKEEWMPDNEFLHSPIVNQDPDIHEQFEKNSQIDALWRKNMESNP